MTLENDGSGSNTNAEIIGNSGGGPSVSIFFLDDGIVEDGSYETEEELEPHVSEATVDCENEAIVGRENEVVVGDLGATEADQNECDVGKNEDDTWGVVGENEDDTENLSSG
ncbi:hypothetical protein V6N13_037601 [Hibiscus sabdariffa]